MAKEFAKPFYNSSAWKKCKASYIVIVFGQCERCRKTGYIVHHKEKLTPANINNPDITLNHKNLEYLCLDCHNTDELSEHSKKIKGEKEIRYYFDAEGNIVPIIDVEENDE